MPPEFLTSLVIATLVAGVAVIKRTSAGGSSWRFQIVGVLVLTALAAGAIHLVSPEGFARNQSAFARMQRVHRGALLPRLTTSQAFELLRDRDGLLVDARTHDSYESWHVKDAIRVAAGVPQFIRLDMLKTTDRSRPILIYCDSGSCSVDQLLATELLDDGFTNLYLLHRTTASINALDVLLRQRDAATRAREEP